MKAVESNQSTASKQASKKGSIEGKTFSFCQRNVRQMLLLNGRERAKVSSPFSVPTHQQINLLISRLRSVIRAHFGFHSINGISIYPRQLQ